jgi:dCTP deaminase
LVLTDREIQIVIEQQLIIVDPPPTDKAYSSTTVDFTLDGTISEFKDDTPGYEKTIDPTHPDYDHEKVLAEITRQVSIPGDGYVFKPGHMILAWTAEYLNLNMRAKIAARIEGKSSLARLGIGVHITAPIIHAGFEGQIRLEMINHGKLPVRLKAGMRICQLCFEQTLGTPVRGYVAVSPDRRRNRRDSLFRNQFRSAFPGPSGLPRVDPSPAGRRSLSILHPALSSRTASSRSKR